MKPDSKGDDNTGEWHDFLETIQAGYRQLNAIERQLDAITEQDWDGPEAKALRKQFARTFADVCSREAYAYIEHCRRKGDAVPDLRRHQGIA